MSKKTKIPGLSYRGNGFFLYTDTSTTRLTDNDVVQKIEKGLGKSVQHISSTAQVGARVHVLQYSHLYQKDMEREAKKLANKFNK